MPPEPGGGKGSRLVWLYPMGTKQKLGGGWGVVKRGGWRNDLHFFFFERFVFRFAWTKNL